MLLYFLLSLLRFNLESAQIQSETCCQTKQVGDQFYTLIGTNDTEAEELGCMDNCIYLSYSKDRVCFTSEELRFRRQKCLDEGDGNESSN